MAARTAAAHRYYGEVLDLVVAHDGNQDLIVGGGYRHVWFMLCCPILADLCRQYSVHGIQQCPRQCSCRWQSLRCRGWVLAWYINVRFVCLFDCIFHMFFCIHVVFLSPFHGERGGGE